jgi:hypothetical protein
MRYICKIEEKRIYLYRVFVSHKINLPTMNTKWKIALLTILGFSTAACCTTKKAAKSEDKAPKKIEAEEEDPRIMLMYGVPFPDGQVARPVEEPTQAETDAKEFPNGAVAKPVTEEEAQKKLEEGEGNYVKGAKDVIADPSNSQFIVIMYNRRYLPEVETIDVRHILINTQAVPSNATAEQKAEIEKANADAKAEAERIYTEWKNCAATEESFALLAKKYTEDTGSAATGGLYENVVEGDTVAEFDAWCFDESRKAGDTEIVQSGDFGYHIMYFVGEGLVQYEAQIREALSVEEYNEYYNEQTKDMPVETYDLGTMLMFS